MKHRPVIRETSQEAVCPFCGLPIERPGEIQDGVPRDMAVGRCENCGAVYVCDVTGHNLGSAFVEALVFACNMDWDLAWDLLPDEDYLQKVVEGYDLVTNRFYPEGILDGRSVRGALSFVRLKQDLQELKGEGVAKRMKTVERADVTVKEERPSVSQGPAPRLNKADIQRCILEYDLAPIVAAARGDKKVFRYLQRMLYVNDETLRLRAAEALGLVVKVVAPVDPTTVVTLLQGLLTPFETSSASYWGSIDAIGEIIGAAPDLFVRYTPRLLPFLDDDALRPAVLRALTKVTQAKPDFMRRLPRRVLPFLESADAQTRGLTAHLLGYLPSSDEVRERLLSLRGDGAIVDIYEGGSLVHRTVGEMAAAAIQKQAL